MPIYEYRCEQCGHRFEAWLRSSSSPEPEECPGCNARRIKRVPSLIGGLKSASGGGASFASDCGPTGST